MSAIDCFLIEKRMEQWFRVDTDEELDIDYEESYWAMPVGAMWWRDHADGFTQRYGPTPRPLPHLQVQTPAGRFCIDCCASDEANGYWTRTGEPPLVTVTPSINIGPEIWHGFLRNGQLVI